MFEHTTKVVQKLYSKRYRITLKYTMENIDKALKVYEYGIMNHKGIVESVRSLYGYRYRRMENFIRELGLWKEGEGWLHLQTTTKIYSGYISRRENYEFIVELSFSYIVPENILENQDIGLCENIVEALLEETGYYAVSKVISTYHVGQEVTGHSYFLCCKQKCDGEMLILKKKRERVAYRKKFDVSLEIANYVINGENICFEKPFRILEVG